MNQKKNFFNESDWKLNNRIIKDGIAIFDSNSSWFYTTILSNSTYSSTVWLSCGSDGKASAYNAGNPGSIPGSGRSPGEGYGSPLQYSCLENPMNGGAC